MAARGVVGLYTVICFYNLYKYLFKMPGGRSSGAADILQILDYGFYVWVFSSLLLFLIAMVGDYDKR